MNSSKIRLTIVIISVILALSMISTTWQNIQAQNTVPTASPTKGKDKDKDKDKSSPTPDINVEKICFAVGPQKANGGSFNNLAGVDVPLNSACVDGEVCIFKVPVHKVPHREQLYFHDKVLQVTFWVKGQQVFDPPCGINTVYFILNNWKRGYYDQNQEKVQLFWYDAGKALWTKMPTQLDTTKDKWGWLTAPANQWGFFALGFPAK